MKNNYTFQDLFDADQNLNKHGQNQRAKVRLSSLIELAKMPQVSTNQ